MRRFLQFLAVAFVVTVAARGPAWAAQKIRVGEIARLSYQWPLWTAIEKGYFADLGLEIDERFFTKPPEAVQALSANATNIAYLVPVDSATVAITKGAKIRLIAGGQEKLIYDLISGPKYANPQALKGTTLGVSSLRSGSTFILKTLLRGNGITYPADYKLLELGGTPKRYAGVKTGGVSAAMVAQPTSFKAEDDGLKILDSAANHIPLFAFASLAANVGWAQSHRKSVVAFLRANAKALRWLYQPSHRAEAVRILVKNTKVKAKYVERSYDSMFRRLKTFTPDGRINEAAHNVVFDLIMEAKRLKTRPAMNAIIDTSYIKEALKGM